MRASRTLGSAARLKTLIKKELLADAEKYGDERRSQLNEQEAAQALKEEDLVPSEPCTVVLSKSGWVRAAKGHEIDAEKRRMHLYVRAEWTTPYLYFVDRFRSCLDEMLDVSGAAPEDVRMVFYFDS